MGWQTNEEQARAACCEAARVLKGVVRLFLASDGNFVLTRRSHTEVSKAWALIFHAQKEFRRGRSWQFDSFENVNPDRYKNVNNVTWERVL